MGWINPSRVLRLYTVAQKGSCQRGSHPHNHIKVPRDWASKIKIDEIYSTLKKKDFKKNYTNS